MIEIEICECRHKNQGEVLPLSVDLEGIDTTSETELRKAIQLALFSTYGNSPIEAQAELDEYFEIGDSLWEDFGTSSPVTVADLLPKAKLAWVEASGYYSYRTFIDLELRYSTFENRWQTYLFWRSNVHSSCPTMDEEIHGGYPSHNRALEIFCDAYNAISWNAILDREALESGDFKLFAEDVHEWDHLYRTTLRGSEMLASTWHYEDGEESTFMTQEGNDELLFSTTDSGEHHVVPVLYEDNEYRHVPAPSGSFAQLILRNLAYAPSEERIDNLMLADAKEKYAAFKKLALEKEGEYRSAIKSF